MGISRQCVPKGIESVPQNTTYTVTGMACQHCVASVTEELSELDGVTGVTVELTTGAVTVASADNSDYGLVQAAIAEAGYQLAG
jgi:copper chaperone